MDSKPSFFDSRFFESKIKTRAVSKKEKILGHLIGPLGLIFVINTIAALVEKFFTQQVGAMYGNDLEMVVAMGTTYETMMTLIKVLGMITGLLIPMLIERTKSVNGRFRPLYLIFGFISIILGFTVFLRRDDAADSYWIYFFILLTVYHTVAATYFYLFRDNIVSLSTRSASEKYQLSFIRKVSWTLLSGIVIGMVINMVVLPLWLEKDINGYATLMIALSIVSIPLLFMEFYYTRERVAEDDTAENEHAKIPLKMQLKALLTNRYYVLLTIIITVITVVDYFKGGNVQYFYVKFCLGGETNALMYTVYQIVAGIPVGLGAIFIYPIAKKYGIKNTTLAGYIMVLFGSILGWIGYDNLILACAGGFIKNLGLLPNSYIFITLLYYAFDDIEYKTGLRLEGLTGVGVIGAVQSLIYAPFAGGYESGLLRLGFVDAEGVAASAAVIRWIVFSFYAFDVIMAVVAIICLLFVDVEKKMPQIAAELQRRKMEKCMAEGIEWIDPEEQKRLDDEAYEREREENRILDLKEHCEKKGLDFDAENEKYLKKEAEKRLKKEAKAARKAARRAK